MKKLVAVTLTSFIVFFMSSFSLYGQGGIGFGAKAGMNYGNISGPEVEKEWINRMALVAGVFVSFNLNSFFAIQPEVLYSRKGPKWDGQFEGKPFKATAEFDYIDVAFLAKGLIPISANSTFRLNLFSGPYVGIKQKAKLKYEWGGESGENELEHIKDKDFGLVFGGGFDFEIGMGRLLVDLRYGMSLSSISKEEEIKNKVFSVMLGYSSR